MRNTSLLSAVIVCSLLSVLPAEEPVNVEYTSGDQKYAAVAASDANGAVIVWSGYISGQSNDILARRLDETGLFIDPQEFRVNDSNAGNQTEPAVAMNRHGAFAVVWQGPGDDEEDIFLRLFDPNASDQRRVNDNTTGRQICPRVAMNDAGVLVVTWESREVIEDVNRSVVHARVFEPDGAALGDELTADTAQYNCRYPDVAVNGDGGFTLVWMRERSGNPIMMRRFDPNGRAITEEACQVSTEAISSVTRPAIAMNSAGYFVVAWDGHPQTYHDDNVWARRYDPNGAALDEQSLLVDAIHAGRQELPRVAINDANEFVVVWMHYVLDPNDPDIFAQRFDAEALPAGDQLQLNTHTQDQQRNPDAALMNDGSFLATWESTGQDKSGYGVFLHAAPPAGP